MSSQATKSTDGPQSGSHDRNIDLRSFDERKTGVKGLVDEGTERIPTIFIRPKDDLSKEFSTCCDNLSVPIIDLAHVRETSSRGDEIIRRIIWASENWGFFQVVNHGIPLDILEKVIEAVKMFHEQDSEIKKQFYSRDATSQFRFNTNYDLQQSKTANWRDTLYVTTSFSGKLFPDAIPPICRDVILAYVNQAIRLGELLLEQISVGLGLEPSHLREMECAKGWNLVGHYYPACPEPELTLGASNHSDPSFLTILLQDHIGGLQVLHQKQWVNIEPVSGALIVNIGDILQMISNDKLKSVNHRVIAKNIGPRISIATFFTGHFLSPKIYGPIKELVSEENPAVYKEFTLQEFFKRFFTKSLDQTGVQYFRQTV